MLMYTFMYQYSMPCLLYTVPISKKKKSIEHEKIWKKMMITVGVETQCNRTLFKRGHILPICLKLMKYESCEGSE